MSTGATENSGNAARPRDFGIRSEMQGLLFRMNQPQNLVQTGSMVEEKEAGDRSTDMTDPECFYLLICKYKKTHSNTFTSAMCKKLVEKPCFEPTIPAAETKTQPFPPIRSKMADKKIENRRQKPNLRE